MLLGQKKNMFYLKRLRNLNHLKLSRPISLMYFTLNSIKILDKKHFLLSNLVVLRD